VKAKDTVVMEIYRELLSVLPQRRRKAVLYVNPAIAERLVGEDGIIRDLRERFKKKVVIKPVEVFHQEEFEIV
jgi:Ribonuclease G/E